MPRRSFIRSLPLDVERLVVHVLLQDRHTIDQVLALVKVCGFTATRSAVGRLKKQFTDEVGRGPDAAVRREQLLGKYFQAGLPKPRVRVKAPSRQAA